MGTEGRCFLLLATLLGLLRLVVQLGEKPTSCHSDPHWFDAPRNTIEVREADASPKCLVLTHQSAKTSALMDCRQSCRPEMIRSLEGRVGVMSALSREARIETGRRPQLRRPALSWSVGGRGRFRTYDPFAPPRKPENISRTERN